MSNSHDINEALQSNYILLRLSMSSWSPNKRDIAAALELAANHGAVSEAYKAVKNIMAGADTELKAVQSAQGQLRTYIYRVSVPWSGAHEGVKKGPRLIPTVKSMDIVKHMAQLQADFDAKLSEFLSVYDQRVTQAIQNLAGSADASLYPTREEIKEKFSVSVDLEPVPTVADFDRMALPANVANALGERMAKRQNAVVENAMSALLADVTQYVGNMATQLGKLANGEKTKLFQSLVENVKMVADLVKTSNLTNDPRLTQIEQQLDELAAIDLKKVRNSASMAKEAAGKAAAVVKTVQGPGPQVLTVSTEPEPEPEPESEPEIEEEAYEAILY